MAWVGGLTSWREGTITYLSITFTWKVREAWSLAVFEKAQGQRVIAGGPAMAFQEMRDIMASVAEVPTKQIFTRKKWHTVGADHPESVVVQRQNPLATLASRGCSEDCYFCTVPVIEGALTLLPDFVPRPILCDNNLSALDPKYQDYIIEKFNGHGVKLLDANSGFEPKTFTPDVYARWKPLLNAGNGPWRFGYDTTSEAPQVRKVMKMLADEPQKRKRVYVLIGNEPFAECMARIQDVLDHGCEPHVQPYIALNALDRAPRDRLDWTAQQMKNVARWANTWDWKKRRFDEYDRHWKRNAPPEQYDEQQGLFA